VLALGYLGAGWLWIAFSDQLGALLFDSTQAITHFQTYKGIGFVAATALLVYAAVGLARAEPAPVPLELPRRSSMSVRMLLTILVLATAVPMAGLLVWHVSRSTTGQVDAANHFIRRVADDGAAELQVFLQSQARVAATVAQRPRVRALDPRNCDGVLAEVPMIDDAIREMATLDLQGRVVCGTHGTSAASSPEWMDRLSDEGGVLLGHPKIDPDTGVWMFGMAYPLRGDDGRVLGALRIRMPVAMLMALIDEPLPQGGVFTIVDREGLIVARSPGWNEFIGEKITNPQRALARSKDLQPFRAVGVDNVERLYSARPVGTAQWIAIAGVPTESIYAPARKTFALSALGALGILALCGWLVVPLSRRIVAPLRALEETARQVAEGDFERRAPETGPLELAGVAAGFNRMMDRLPELQRALRESELRHRRLIGKLSSNVPGVIFEMRVDRQGRLAMPFVSERVHEMFELDARSLMRHARSWLTRIHPQDRGRVAEALARSQREVSRLSVEFRVLLSGGIRHCLVQSQPERDSDGGTVWFGAAMDVTGMKDAQRALQIQSETLEQRVNERTADLATANEALESFTYSVAHDLRAPLQVIDGFSKALSKSMHEGNLAKADGYNARVIASAKHMGDLIDGFLALARAGRKEVGKDRVETVALVRELRHALDPQRRVEWKIAPLPAVVGDTSLLRQAWSNLLSNAVKYSAGREQPVVDIGCELAGGEVVFEVRDNGAGFDPQYASGLFAPFQRLHKAGEFEGTGVGLAITRRIVERHGGRIWGESQVGAGAVFRFSLPRERVVREG
jgi:signal transduction histidine kinase